MIYLAYIVLGFTGLQLLIALANVIFGQRLYGRSHQDDLVSVLIPARNEAENIRHLLSDLKDQEYRNIEILVFDDESTDATAEVVNRCSGDDSRVKIYSSTGLREGWLGKNWACHNLALNANGHYFLFLDADVRIGKSLISKTLAEVKKEKLGLLSIFPKQLMMSVGEWATVPLMNYILLTLLPMILVRKSSFSSLSAANGQFMLFDAAVYRKYLPHQLMRNHKVEDIAIIRLLKNRNVRVACLAGVSDITCRMYRDFSEAAEGFSKNMIMFFGNSTLLAIVFWLITTLGFIPVLIAMPASFAWLYLLLVVLIRILVSVGSRQNMINNIIFLIPQQLAMGFIITTSIRNKFKKQTKWKGRNIG